jgi:hypothetical protein
MLAVDISNYTTPLTANAVEGLKSAGVTHVIVQSIDPPPGYPAGRTRQQIELCQAAGLSVDVYVWLWFDLDIRDIHRKLKLIEGLQIRQLWLDVEDTASSKYDQATSEAKVTAALAACDAFQTTSGQKTGIYSGRWFWADQRYMGNTTLFADRELWDANYDEVADAALGFRPYGGWSAPRIKQYRGTSVLAGVGGLDLNVLSVDEAAEITGGQTIATQPQGTAQPEERETPAEWPWPTWYEAAVNYKAIADQLGGQEPAVEGRETPEDWPWPTWYEAAVNYKAISDNLGEQLAARPAPA